MTNIRAAISIRGVILLRSVNKMAVKEDDIPGLCNGGNFTVLIYAGNFRQLYMKFARIVRLRNILIDWIEVGTGDEIHATVFLVAIIYRYPSAAQRIRRRFYVEGVLMIGLASLLRRLEKKH